MKLAFINKEGALELRWMWLPTFIGQNFGLMNELQEAWKRSFPNGVPADNAEEVAHAFAVQWLQDKLHIPGLGEWLEAIEVVEA